jgi:hypothetical protein
MPPELAADPDATEAMAPADLDHAMSNARGIASLAADLILGRARIVVLASLADAHGEEELVDRLCKEALEHGLSVARVDAGSHQPTSEPGLTDLAADTAGFGDVVYKATNQQLAEVPWGQLASLDVDSAKPATLIEALSDIYEVVLVGAGPLSQNGAAGLFAGLDARLVLVGAADEVESEAGRTVAMRLGYEHIEALAVPAWRAEVA